MIDIFKNLILAGIFTLAFHLTVIMVFGAGVKFKLFFSSSSSSYSSSIMVQVMVVAQTHQIKILC